MKFNSFNWNLYKDSPQGKKLIEDFATIQDVNGFTELVARICPDSGINTEAFANVLDGTYAYKVSDLESAVEAGEQLTVADIWHELISTGYVVEDEVIVRPGDFRGMIDVIPFLTIGLYISFPDSFVPYLFLKSFSQLAAILAYYEVTLPPMPSKKDYEGRCYYYIALNDVLLDFRNQIGLSPEEFCAFLYDFAPAQIEDVELPSSFSRMWISGGIPGHKDIDKTYYWGNNPSARKGDLMLLYEIAPVSAITSIWRLTSDVCVDPFFHWNASASVRHVADFSPITLKDLREDTYFANHPLVRRNMQGVNGTAWSAVDYKNLLRLIAAKGFDVSTLPKMDGLDISRQSDDIHLEKEVEEKLLLPLLKKLNIEEGSGYIRQLPLKAGRGRRIFPDFAVYYSDKEDEESAHILIEAKYDIRNVNELDAAFRQARSYAHLLNSSVIILCDKNLLFIYKKDSSTWSGHGCVQVSWGELADPDKYAEVAKIFDRKQYL